MWIYLRIYEYVCEYIYLERETDTEAYKLEILTCWVVAETKMGL